MRIRIVKYRIQKQNAFGFFVAFCSFESGRKIGKTYKSCQYIPGRKYFVKTTYGFLKELYASGLYFPVADSGIYTTANDYYNRVGCQVLEDCIIDLKGLNETWKIYILNR